jgi:hypothetical protein
MSMRRRKPSSKRGRSSVPAKTSSARGHRAIVAQFTDEVQYLNESEIAQRTSPEGRFFDGATLNSVDSVQSTERVDVKRVDVGISKGHLDFNGRTYLFLWSGDRWGDTSPDAVNVTVTSSVS